jgi:hypothetical protein
MLFLRLCVVLLAGAALAVFVTAFARTQEETKEAEIKSAMAGGPPEIAKNARIVEFGERGSLTTLREGSNGWTCFPGHPGTMGAMCLDEPALQWLTDLITHKPKPTNTRPGILYMLAAGGRNKSECHGSMGDKRHARQGASTLGAYLAIRPERDRAVG